MYRAGPQELSNSRAAAYIISSDCISHNSNFLYTNDVGSNSMILCNTTKKIYQFSVKQTMATNSVMAYYVGIAIVVLSHLYIVVQGIGPLTLDQHAYLNLVAAGLIAWGWMENCM